MSPERGGTWHRNSEVAWLADMDERIYVDLKSLMAFEHQARGFSFLPRQPLHSVLSGKHGSRLRGRGLNFEELRHYRPGDDIRTMDWKVTNRTGKPHVRTYTEERERTVVLLIDQRQNMFFGSRDRMKSVVAAEAAALSAWRVRGAGDRVGAVVFNDERISQVRPHRSERNVMEICHQVCAMNHALHAEALPDPQVHLNDALARALRICAHDGLLVLISDMSGWNDRSLTLLKRHSVHNDALVALVYDPLEAEFADTRSLVVSDGRLQIEVSAARNDLRARFTQAYTRAFEALCASLARYDIPVLQLNTTEPVPGQVRRAMGHPARMARVRRSKDG